MKLFNEYKKKKKMLDKKTLIIKKFTETLENIEKDRNTLSLIIFNPYIYATNIIKDLERKILELEGE